MAEQLALHVEIPETAGCPPLEVDLAASVLRAPNGDTLAAICNLLADADFLRDQLFIASSLMSKGIGRLWKPRYERLAP